MGKHSERLRDLARDLQLNRGWNRVRIRSSDWLPRALTYHIDEFLFTTDLWTFNRQKTWRCKTKMRSTCHIQYQKDQAAVWLFQFHHSPHNRRYETTKVRPQIKPESEPAKFKAPLKYVFCCIFYLIPCSTFTFEMIFWAFLNCLNFLPPDFEGLPCKIASREGLQNYIGDVIIPDFVDTQQWKRKKAFLL